MQTADLSRRAFLAGAGTVLASVTVPLASTPAFAANASLDAATTTAPNKIIILGTNDLHGTLENPRTKLGYAALKDYVAAQREVYGTDNVTLADSGDFAQGNPSSTLSDGKFPVQAMAACGYDVAAPGNHDFDYGVDALIESAQARNLPLTCCNFTDATGACVFEPYHVIEYPAGSDTVRVAYVGVTIPSTRGTSDNFKDADGNFIYDFAIDETGDALVSAVQAAVDDARTNAAADYVILLAHLGQSWTPAIWRSDTLISKTNGIDAVLDAHTHQLYVQALANKDGQEVPVVQTGYKFTSFSRLEIDLNARTATASAVACGVTGGLVKTWDGADDEVAALLEEIDEQIAQMTSEHVGTSEVDLIGLADDGTQATWLGETNLGDFAADAMLNAAKAAGVPCDVAFLDPFAICRDIAAGEVTRGSVMEAFPLDRPVYELEVSGQHLLDMLECGCAVLPIPACCLLQPSDGFSYTVRTDIETPVSFSPTNYSLAGIEGERRVTSAELNGQQIEADKRYAVVAPAGILAGSFGMPKPDSLDGAVQIGMLNDIVISYITDELGGTIGSEYGDPAGTGRIAVFSQADGEGSAAGNAASAGTETGGSLTMAAVTATAVGAIAVAAAKGE